LFQKSAVSAGVRLVSN